MQLWKKGKNERNRSLQRAPRVLHPVPGSENASKTEGGPIPPGSHPTLATLALARAFSLDHGSAGVMSDMALPHRGKFDGHSGR